MVLVGLSGRVMVLMVVGVGVMVLMVECGRVMVLVVVSVGE